MSDAQDFEQWMFELTALPTAAGREDAVIQWITSWVSARDYLTLKTDTYGNMMVQRKGVRGKRPVVITAHMDHPAFVVNRLVDTQCVEAEFRGGVQDNYFLAGPPDVVLHHADGHTRGTIAAFKPPVNDGFKGARIELHSPAPAAALGDVCTWQVGMPRRLGDKFETLACDDLASLTAGLAALDIVLGQEADDQPDFRMLLTRAEECGFIGAIGAAREEFVPKGAKVINLECSKSFADSPIGGGPIIRVGDRTSTFNSDLTHAITKIAETRAENDQDFRFQRKLMPGGTCEASAFQTYGYTATCICLPLGNYHNMDENRGIIAAEHISVNDFHCMVALLVDIAWELDTTAKQPILKEKLDKLFDERRYLLEDVNE